VDLWAALDYGQAESDAVIRGAYQEILTRQPTPDEVASWYPRLQQEHLAADDLRRSLLTSVEFISRYGKISPSQLQSWRTRKWIRALGSEWQKRNLKKDAWPNSIDLYQAMRHTVMGIPLP
jgi:hypothetical protein